MLLFIFFIRDLPQTVVEKNGIDAGVPTPIILHADDVTEMSRTLNCLEIETRACVAFFKDKDLAVNPGKSDVMKFVRPRALAGDTFTCDTAGVPRISVGTARYLGVLFEERGRWKEQKRIV